MQTFTLCIKHPFSHPPVWLNTVHYSWLPNAELQIKPYATVQPPHTHAVRKTLDIFICLITVKNATDPGILFLLLQEILLV